MGLLTRHQLKAIVSHIPEVRAKLRLKEKEKRKKEKESEDGLSKNTMMISLNKLGKLPASDILKLLYNLKENKQKFVLN
jgi:hypothetical protein